MSSLGNRICYYSIATQLGGAERSLLDLLVRLKSASQNRYIPWVLLPKSNGPLIDLLDQNHIEWSSIELPSGLLAASRQSPMRSLARGLGGGLTLLPSYLRTVSQDIRRHEVSLVHTTGIKCHLLSAMAKWQYPSEMDLPILWHLRDIMEPGATLACLRYLAKSGKVHLVANSEATAKAFGRERSGIEVVYNGIDPTTWKHTSDAPKSEGTPFKIGMIGVIARWKGQLEFLRMAKILLDRGINAQFYVVGGEIYDTTSDRGFGNELKEEAQVLGLDRHVSFTGQVSNPSELLSGFDVLVHASVKPEPFGRVIIEAMATGVPVVASAAGGVLEILTHEQNGLLFEPGSVTEMADAVERVLKDNPLRQRISESAGKVFSERFTIDRHVQQVISIYDRILAP